MGKKINKKQQQQKAQRFNNIKKAAVIIKTVKKKIQTSPSQKNDANLDNQNKDSNTAQNDQEQDIQIVLNDHSSPKSQQSDKDIDKNEEEKVSQSVQDQDKAARQQYSAVHYGNQASYNSISLRRQRSTISNEQKKELEKAKRIEKLKLFAEQFEKNYGLNNFNQEKDHQKPYKTLPNTFYKGVSSINQRKSNNKQPQIVPGRVGLMNLGNTCFMNSVIQSLSNIQPLTDYFLKDFYLKEINRNNPLGSKGLIAIAYGNLIKQIWKNKESITSMAPEEFHNIIGHINNEYATYMQQDAQEFMIFLLDKLHEDFNRVQKKPYIEQKEYTVQVSDKELEKLAADAWKDYLLRNKSVIVDLFQGQIKNTIKCRECQYTKYNFEPFMYLSLPLREEVSNKRVSVTECIEEYLKEEILCGDNQWYCPHCKKHVDSSKKIDFWKLPNILLMSFKRFKYTADEKKKIKSCIDFEDGILTLTEYIQAQFQKEAPIYDMIAAVCHHGGLSYGHYISYAKNKESQNWYQFNDSKTKCVSNPNKEIPGSGIYMLLYTKSTIKLIRNNTITDPSMWPHMITDY